MSDVSIQDEPEAALATALRAQWEQAHGVPAGKVRVLVGPDSVAAWIEEVFSPAEWAVARRVEGQSLLQRYVEQLLSAIQPEMRVQVEAITGRRIVSANIRPDVDTGHVLCFFVLGER
ncbi:MAG: Na-translocating system protein MpsC family protein, partial [Chloroflexota bacterium]